MTDVIRNIKIGLNDRIAGRVALLFIFLYILGYGLFVSKGFHFDKLNVYYLPMLVTIFLVDAIKTTLESLKRGKFYTGYQDLSQVTVVIPSINGEAFLDATLKDLLNRFPPERIIVASNGSTDNTCQIARNRGVVVIDHPDAIGKVSAINMALHKVQTTYTLLLDDDTLIGDAVIPTQALDEGFDGVAFRVFPKIRTWVTKIQMYEYRKSMDIGRRFHNANATVQNVSGAIGLFNTHELIRQINIHTGEFSGEDLQRTLLIHLSEDPKGVVISDSIIETEVPTTLGALFRQRVYGWNPGLLSNVHRYFALLLRSKRTPTLLRYEAFYNSILVLGMDPLRLISFPIIIFYPQYFGVIYIMYVMAETIPYLALRRQDPYWVILIYPFYGLFGFISRIAAMMVFVYRRVAVLLSSSQKLDDYVNSRFTHKIAGLITIVLLGSGITALPAFFRNVLPYPSTTEPTIREIIKPVAKIDVATNAPVVVALYHTITITLPDFYIIPLENGDGKSNIARKAILAYCSDAGISLSEQQRLYVEDSISKKMTTDLPRYKPGVTVQIPSRFIVEEVDNIY